ncbi:hypothetical protein FB45DRAFT_1110328 [Roridomyces roridus]|uniref:Chromo domain-containing protein n=1 Tax=Roridomyces roridus TaxID=1738132 RepID=A0AAD7B9J9_9AGAR|nr:hypothetical protein FB45DRAFT_1110328 [Roridomyces roridus]
MEPNELSSQPPLENVLTQINDLLSNPDLPPEVTRPLQAAAAAAQAHMTEKAEGMDIDSQPPGSLAPEDSRSEHCRGRPRFEFLDTPVESEAVDEAYANPNEPRLYGLPLGGVNVLKPPVDRFIWDTQSLSRSGKPEPSVLQPCTAAPKPEVGWYPQASKYALNTTIDNSYRRGWRYAADYHHATRAEDKEHTLQVRMPPDVTPARFDLNSRAFVSSPIPGMIRMPAGIPFVHHLDGDPHSALTVACVHTLTTLGEYQEGKRVAALMPRLLELTWGREASDTDPGMPAVFELEGLQLNLRSKSVKHELKGDGSFNLASTHGEGEGRGHFAPAVQTNTPEAAAQIKELLEILHELYQLIMPLSVSRFEWEMIRFQGLENNVLAFGGLEPGPTSCQLNSSSAANVLDFDLSETDSVSFSERNFIDLKEYASSERWRAGKLGKSIGPQGKPHGDFQDDPLPLTLFVLLFRLANGSDMGPFLFMRSALYIRETDEYILFASFRGHDIHSGTVPTYVKQLQDSIVSMEDAQELFKKFGPQVRCGYVLYPSMTATTRSTQTLYTPSLRFLYTPADPRIDKRRYFVAHGNTILGDNYSRSNRLGLEMVLAMKNWITLSGLNLKLSTDELLHHITYGDEKGAIHSLEPAPFDIDDDNTYALMTVYRRYLFYWRGIIASYSLGLTKSEFLSSQQSIARKVAGFKDLPPIPTERSLVPRITFSKPGAPAAQATEHSTCTSNPSGCIQDVEASTSDSSASITNMLPDVVSTVTADTPLPDSTTGPLTRKRCRELADNPEMEEPPPKQRKKGEKRRSTPVYTSSEEDASDSEKDKEAEMEDSRALDSNVFVVKAILASEISNGERRWLVQWAGYDLSENTWEPAAAFKDSESSELFDKFNSDHGIDLVRKCKKKVDHTPPNVEIGKAVAAQPNTKYIDALLNSSALLNEYEQVEGLRQVLVNPKEINLANVAPREIASSLVDQINRQNQLSTQLHLALHSTSGSSDSTGWNPHLADLTFACICDIGNSVSVLEVESGIQDLVSRGAQAQVCRSLVAAYEWLVYLSPSLAAQLVELQKEKPTELADQFPKLAPMVAHIVAFVQESARAQIAAREVDEAKKKKKPGRKPKTKKHPDPKVAPQPPPAADDPVSGAVESTIPVEANRYSSIPADLWGLIPASARTAEIRLQPINLKNRFDSPDSQAVYDVAANLLCRLWDEHLLLRPMSRVWQV